MNYMRFGIHIGPTLFKSSQRCISPELAQKIDTSRNPVEWLAELLAVAAVITHIMLLVNGYGLLPDIIPSHFGFDGQINDYSGKGTLLFLLGINIVMYVAMTATANFPRLYNFPVAITAENAQRQFLLARGMLLGIKAIVVWMFCYMSYQISAVALGLASGMGWPLWLLLGLLLAVTGITLALSYKWR